MNDDIYCYSDQNLLIQLETAPEKLGYRLVHFYVDETGLPAKEKNNNVETFYLAPSGGTLRDKNMNIVHYSAKFDIYGKFRE